jgi:enediyne biosynthesis protein E4
MAARLRKSSLRPVVSVLVLLSVAAGIALQGTAVPRSNKSPIHFSFSSIPFSLDSSESFQKHAPETMAGGVAVFDYNNDGNLDIFFTNGADIVTLNKTSPKYSNRLFRNNGNGTFTDVTEQSGLAGTGYDVGVAIGDYDNDGYEDIFVGGVHRNTLYHNNGDGTFTDVTIKAGLAQPDKEFGPLWSVGGAWVDVNNDGLLDLFVVNYMSWNVNKEPDCKWEGKPEYCHPKMYKALPNQLNNGDGTFQDVSAQSGIRSHLGKGMGVGVADYDGDGLPDIFVANDKVFNFLFHNKGHVRFDEVAFEAGVSLPEQGNVISGMGVDFRDLDNDGRPDITLVGLDNETFPVFRNDGKAGFTDITATSGMALLSSPMAGYSANIADFDNDGWKDIFVSRGHVQSPNMAGRQMIDQPNTVFRNLLGTKWSALTEEAGLTAQPPRRHRGAAVGDFNHDGKLDIVVTALGAPAEVWMNDSPDSNHWLELALAGTKSNRDGIGARIRLSAGGSVQSNHASTAAGYASSAATPVHFGLGTAKVAEEIEIRWPSGTVQKLKDVPGNQVLHVKEPK